MFSQRTNWNLSRNRFADAIEAARQHGAELLDLTASNPTAVGLTYDTDGILKALADPRGLGYEPASKGMRVGREAVASYYAEQGIACNPENLVLTVSTSEAYSYCFRLLCDPGDEVLVPAPSYPLFEFLADIQDVNLVPYELVYDHGWQIEFESLQHAITPRSRAVMVVHPNNPTGHYTKAWEVERLNALCSENEMAIVADEVFLDYALEAGSRVSFAENRGALTFTLSGLSKISGLPQMKAAWILVSGPEAVAHEALGRLEVIADTYLSPNAPVQWALPALLGSRRGVQGQLNERTRSNLTELDRQLAKQHLLERLRVEGGWYAVLRVPVTRTDEDLAIELLEHESVLVHPGHFFNFAGDGYLVVSLITPTEEFCAGVKRIVRYLQR